MQGFDFDVIQRSLPYLFRDKDHQLQAVISE